jgi:hypothetical protein
MTSVNAREAPITPSGAAFVAWQAVREVVLKSDGWNTIETAWNIPKRRICVEPVHPLRVRMSLGLFSITIKKSKTGCITYGGWTSIAPHKVQVQGKKGERIIFTQDAV